MGTTAYTVIESDEWIPDEILEDIKSSPNIQDLMLSKCERQEKPNGFFNRGRITCEM